MTTSSPKKLFCFGHGYTADYLSHNLLKTGQWEVGGTTRDPAKQAALNARHIEAHIFDYERPLPHPSHTLKDVTHLLISTPPDETGDPVFKLHHRDIENMKDLEWIGYLSTTGVYGDRKGEWVDESAKVWPTTKRGTRRVKAEEQWLSLKKTYDLPVHIFRLSGIYGPGRSALDSVRAGMARRIHKEGHAFGRIHVEDIAQILEASMNNPASGEIYNLADDCPSPGYEVIDYACHLLGRPLPPLVDFQEADLSPITRSFYMDNRRISNQKIKEALGINLKYPSFKEGVKACMEAEDYSISLFKGMKGS